MPAKARNTAPPRRVGVDSGGTFTDVIALVNGELTFDKVPSTPEDPSRAVLDGLERCVEAGPDTEVVHGTTVALNALLTRRLAKTALVTNRGFRDLIEIGRQERPELYALHPQKPEPLVPRRLRFEIAQRSWPNLAGELVEIERPSTEDLEALNAQLARSGAESVAICLLHSYEAPEIEERLARALESIGLPLTLSSHVLPEYREVERFSTAIANAALVPLMRRYLGGLEARLRGAPLSIMQSAGGTMPAARAAEEPVHVVLSGPAGGVVGAAAAAEEAGFGSIVTLDMGGTSTDVAFHSPQKGLLHAVTDAGVDGLPIAVPALDIHTIGCGGGSLVRVDAGGVLHVGPESAGADPGPVSYGKGEVLTVTDAHVLLGHIAPGTFLGGRLELRTDAVEHAFEKLSSKLGTSPIEAAGAVLEVARASMRRALSVMTMQRGEDPRSLPLVAFGGAGGLHAAALAESLEMQAALVPQHSGLLSARGMLAAEVMRDHSRSMLSLLSNWPAARRRKLVRELRSHGRAELVESGHAASRVAHEVAFELRYRGQSFELALEDGSELEARFHARHEELYGYALTSREVELVTVRVRSRIPRTRPAPTRARRRALPAAAVIGHRSAWFDRRRRTQVIDRSRLRAGHAFEGPALVEEYSGTTLVPPGWSARVTSGGHLSLSLR